MHLNRFWTVLKKNSQVNFLQGYCTYESNDIKKFITRLILSTDVAKHFKGLETLKQFSKYKKPLEGENSIVNIILFRLFWNNYFMHVISAILVLILKIT